MISSMGNLAGAGSLSLILAHGRAADRVNWSSIMAADIGSIFLSSILVLRWEGVRGRALPTG